MNTTDNTSFVTGWVNSWIIGKALYMATHSTHIGNGMRLLLFNAWRDGQELFPTTRTLRLLCHSLPNSASPSLPLIVLFLYLAFFLSPSYSCYTNTHRIRTRVQHHSLHIFNCTRVRLIWYSGILLVESFGTLLNNLLHVLHQTSS